MNALAYLFSSKPIPDDPIPEESNPVKVVRPSSNLRMPTIAFSAPRSKVQLKLSIQRLRLLSSKKAQLAKVTRREIGALLEKGKLETARIKVEGVMGDDSMVELLEVLELYCELILARFGLLETNSKELDGGIAEAVNGIIFAAPRTELKELQLLRELLMVKFGREISIAAIDNAEECVSKRITARLEFVQPPETHINAYLYEIAQAYSIDWRPEGMKDPAASAVPTAVDLETVTKSPVSHPAVLEPFPSVPPVEPAAAPRTVIISSNLPPAVSPSVSKSDQDSFDALTKRFADLKKR